MTEHHEEKCQCHENIHKLHPEESCHKECCNYPEKLMELANLAWKELLKEKIKAEIDKNDGARIQELAVLLTNANKEKWKHKMMAKMKCEEYKNNLKEFFSSK